MQLGYKEEQKRGTLSLNLEKDMAKKITNVLFDSRKDFIVLGLCGKTGSGVTTLADILTTPFQDWGLPNPGKTFRGTNEESEYRILYDFAEKNLNKFYKIKVSSLITATILEHNKDAFWKYIEESTDEPLAKKFQQNITQTRLTDPTRGIGDSEGGPNLFEATMLFNWKTYKNLHKEELETIEASDVAQGADSGERDLALICKILELKPERPYYEIFIDANRNHRRDAENIALPFSLLQDLFQSYLTERKKYGQQKSDLRCELLHQYLFYALPKAVRTFWNQFPSEKSTTSILQNMGNNLRLSGNPYLAGNETSYRAKSFRILAERINMTIKVLRDYTEHLKSRSSTGQDLPRTMVVIDSIKNPFESLYLKERYSNYYLIAVYTEDSQRKIRLELSRKLSLSEIEAIDTVEQFSAVRETESEQLPYPIKTINGLSPLLRQFIVQNVGACIESADIFINNEKDSENRLKLKQTILRYVCLIMSPGLILPTNIERCMQIAFTAKSNSGCISRQVGAVITDKKYGLRSIGWNQTPEGQMPCTYRDLVELHYGWNPTAYSSFEKEDHGFIQTLIGEAVERYYGTEASPLKRQGKECVFCFKDLYPEKMLSRSLHAEETAFLNVKDGNLDGGFLFSTTSPCELCAKKAVYMGIQKIYYIESYSGISFSHVLAAGPADKQVEAELFTGAIGRAYTQMYTPIFPKKDEVELWLGQRIQKETLETGKWKPDEFEEPGRGETEDKTRE